MGQWQYIELGGSSSQTAWRTPTGSYHFAPGVVWHPGQRVALACPGLIRGRQVWYASNLGWPEVADPAAELQIASPQVLVNDAAAAALGEAVLRDGDNPPDLYYIGLGTGVGSAQIEQGRAREWNLGHTIIGGDAFCSGCHTAGCLNAYLAAACLPTPLGPKDLQQLAERLADACQRIGADRNRLIVLAGGIARRYPSLIEALTGLLSNEVRGTSAAREAKSAAYAGLHTLALRSEGAF